MTTRASVINDSSERLVWHVEAHGVLGKKIRFHLWCQACMVEMRGSLEPATGLGSTLQSWIAQHPPVPHPKAAQSELTVSPAFASPIHPHPPGAR